MPGLTDTVEREQGKENQREEDRERGWGSQQWPLEGQATRLPALSLSIYLPLSRGGQSSGGPLMASRPFPLFSHLLSFLLPPPSLLVYRMLKLSLSAVSTVRHTLNWAVPFDSVNLACSTFLVMFFQIPNQISSVIMFLSSVGKDAREKLEPFSTLTGDESYQSRELEKVTCHVTIVLAHM